MRICAVLLLIFPLVECNRGVQNNDAVRQGVVDHLERANMPVDVSLTSVQFKGEDADATVSITPKGGNQAAGMSMNYHLRLQGNKWVVVGRPNGGANPHGAMAVPDGANPHGDGAAPDVPNPHASGMAAPGGGARMPSPDDLPPAGKKK